VFDSLRAMPPLSHPLRFLLVALSAWINQQECDAIDYLQEEIRVLPEQLGQSSLSSAAMAAVEAPLASRSAIAS